MWHEILSRMEWADDCRLHQWWSDLIFYPSAGERDSVSRGGEFEAIIRIKTGCILEQEVHGNGN